MYAFASITAESCQAWFKIVDTDKIEYVNIL